jgi:hypothetical protein
MPDLGLVVDIADKRAGENIVFNDGRTHRQVRDSLLDIESMKVHGYIASPRASRHPMNAGSSQNELAVVYRGCFRHLAELLDASFVISEANSGYGVLSVWQTQNPPYPFPRGGWYNDVVIDHSQVSNTVAERVFEDAGACFGNTLRLASNDFYSCSAL